MHKLLALALFLMAVTNAHAQTVVGDRLRLNAGPCGITSVDASPDKLIFTPCPVLTTDAATNLTLAPAGDLILGPVGVDVLPNTGYTVNLGALTNKYLTLHAAELWVETLVAQNTIATIGGRVLVAPTTVLTSDLGSGATSISVKHNQMSNGDRVYLEANGQVEFMAITSSASGSGPYTYTVTRNLDGSGANNWSAGDAVLNTGTTGNGFIDLYSTSGVLSGSGPTIVGNVRTGTTYNQIAPRWAIGNLNGLYGYGAETYGTAFGDASNTNVTIDATNGIRMRSGTTNRVLIDTSGNITIGNSSGNKLTYDVSSGALVLAGANGWGRNQIPNSECMVGTENWAVFTNSAGTPTLANNQPSFRLNDKGTCFFTVSGTPANGTVTQGYTSPITFPVQAASRYEASAYLGVQRTGNTHVSIQWYDASAMFLSQSNGTNCTAASVGGLTLADYCRSGLVATAPANATTAVVLVETTHTGGSPAGTDPYVFWVRAFFGEATATQTLLTEWGPAGLTEITGGLIRTGTIVADNIAANTITAAKIAAGTITATEIAANTITAGKLNVTSLSAISADLGTVTAGTINGITINGSSIVGGTIDINSGAFVVDAAGAVTAPSLITGVLSSSSTTTFTAGFSVGVSGSVFLNNLVGAGSAGGAALCLGATGLVQKC